jgi:hypothetical protein
MRQVIHVAGVALVMACGWACGGGQDHGSVDASGVDASGQDSAVNDATAANDATGHTISLSGKLVARAQASPTKSPLFSSPPRLTVAEPGQPLANYQLYCVTFANPPSAATGTADATGLVAINLNALGVAFGCFVLDPEGDGVATLIFTSASQRGQTITLAGDTDLGNIGVDLMNGVAEIDVTSTGTLTGSTGFPCPLGTWVTTVPRQDCTGSASVTILFAKNPVGQYTASFTIGPIMLPDTLQCGYHSQMDLPATPIGSGLTFSFLHDYTCPAVVMTVTAMPNSACTELTMEGAFGGCASCAPGQCGCGVGSQACSENYTVTRQ